VVSAAEPPRVVNLSFLDQSRYFFFQVTKLRQQVAVAQSVYFACGLKATELILLFWPVNEMTEPVCGMPGPQFEGRTNLRECLDQKVFNVQAVPLGSVIPLFRYDDVSCARLPYVGDHWYRLATATYSPGLLTPEVTAWFVGIAETCSANQ
jgi:hypothetical protein